MLVYECLLRSCTSLFRTILHVQQCACKFHCHVNVKKSKALCLPTHNYSICHSNFSHSVYANWHTLWHRYKLFFKKSGNCLLQHRFAPTAEQLSEELILTGNRGVCLRSTDLLQQRMWQPSKLLTYGKQILSTRYALNPNFRITLWYSCLGLVFNHGL
jgi:hypothetical protein